MSNRNTFHLETSPVSAFILTCVAAFIWILVITKFCSERIAKYAFEYAYLNNRKKVTAVHKANIMKLADGLFLESCREVASKYRSIQYNEMIVDNCSMQLVSKPEQFDVMVEMLNWR
ncbi:UNVERIFIED_CONTAM: Isocitrate dehydrogenase [NAD] regulatory subunit, mitochondrial [Sesamum radiatum]|uniref:Isocitrate dehydrogenase [NAD] regulatory subunit, mitochondrial n=1 Tax=Sesamum radiatum TaxID=300843 RepID=A0AAW2S458_SESRA